MSALGQWNALPPRAAERELLACCASPVWARAVAAGRPYPSVDAILLSGADALARLSWTEIEQALQAHPRIGDRTAAAQDIAATWSRREQRGAAEADAATATALVEANREYEERFGHIFLIFATGRSAAEMLAAARSRLRNDDSTEQIVIRHELCKITRLRLERLLDS